MQARIAIVNHVLAVRRLALIVLLGHVAGACHTWQVQSAPATALSIPARIARVSLVDSSRVMLRSVYVESDSLIGRSTSFPSLRVAIPLAAVRSVELEKLDVERSVGWGVLLFMLTGATLVFFVLMTVPAN